METFRQVNHTVHNNTYFLQSQSTSDWLAAAERQTEYTTCATVFVVRTVRHRRIFSRGCPIPHSVCNTLNSSRQLIAQWLYFGEWRDIRGYFDRLPQQLVVLFFLSLFETSQSLFWASFGLVDLTAFDLAGIKSFTRFWALLVFGCYSVINIIVLLNMLIAMMSNSYQIISVSGKAMRAFSFYP